jgi:hypothetical protein
MASELFRSGLLDGQVIVIAAGTGAHGDAIERACADLGATVERLEADPLDEEATAAAVAALPRIDALVDDTSGRFAAGDGLPGLRAAADGAWIAARAVATARLIDADAGGKLVFVAPGPRAGEHAEATRAAIENLARTLSIEWARLGCARWRSCRGRDPPSPRSPSSSPTSPRRPAPTTPAARSRSRSHSSAQGTSTESSVGESRATTYSAGSALERFWRMCVSRGGT